MDAKITAAVIKQTEIVPGIAGMTEIRAGFDDGTTDVLVFSYFDDELTFTVDEFVGMTAAEARDLHRTRDLEYLRS